MAVTLTVQQLAYGLRLIADTTDTVEEPMLAVLTRTLGAATELVQDYASAAPESVQNEATLRLAGYLYDTPPSIAGASQHPLRDSGALALLSTYRVRRAVKLED